MRKMNTWARGLDKKYETEGHAAHDAATRLTSNDYLEISHTAKFQLSNDMSFYMIGSCFAREIEKAFLREGRQVLSQINDLPAACDEQLKGDNSSIMTKFTTHSMLVELNQCLNDVELPGKGLIEATPGQFFNPQLHRLRTLEYTDAVAVQDTVRTSVKRIQDADVVFITLGLTEVWWDDELQVPMNVAPIHWKFAREGNRFRFENTDYAENLKSVHTLINLIREKSNKDVKIILTVSPVPLNRTFTDQDIIVANSYSKSTLRTVAQEVEKQYDFVDYFPSYELVTNTPQEKAWRHDIRHVQTDMVRHVISTFVANYMN
ncbi:GSCFA domain-containing protein [Tritonibacter horizontis]|uniref:GSCFA family protein n=1 Tax=Tritonibacter horizontis TaxID=1768241 RepID=A0A132BZ93_9RHOB|nr:GSCFA domain-containing protein [Tritonibacter horizontis]KUP93556.1 GSCFA family protein [Tritonibacter horizontis]